MPTPKKKAAKKVTSKKSTTAKASSPRAAKAKPRAKKVATVPSPPNKKAGKAKSAAPTTRRLSRGVATLLTASIDVVFTNTNPGLSKLTGTCNGEERELTQSGVISFPNVGPGDIILIQADSLGSTTATIDISATPATLSFAPGAHSGTFLIN